MFLEVTVFKTNIILKNIQTGILYQPGKVKIANARNPLEKKRRRKLAESGKTKHLIHTKASMSSTGPACLKLWKHIHRHHKFLTGALAHASFSAELSFNQTLQHLKEKKKKLLKLPAVLNKTQKPITT